MKRTMIERITDYLFHLVFDKCFKVTKKSVKEMIEMVYLDDIVEEVIKEFESRGWKLKELQ